MRTRLALVMVTLGLAGSMLGTTSSFAADPKGDAKKEEKEKKAEKRKFNFNEDTISTDYLKPGTTLIEGVTRGRRSSLIDVRLDFVSELLRSADDI